ncbi:hypothetical protein [Rhodoplanes sp.]|uniref:hypothetical protein n=1 Tax=Rhodoplanes sp. TaxID=1968906 RepID=UPI00345B8676
MPDIARRHLVAGTLLFAAAGPAFAQSALDPQTRLLAQAPRSNTAMTMLFKIVSARDEIVIGLSEAELDALGGRDAGAVARALKTRGELTAWQYAVRKSATGELEQAPRQKVGLLAHESIRVEPYPTPLAVLSHD